MSAAEQGQDADPEVTTTTDEQIIQEGKPLWSPTGNFWKDFLFFSGPGWFVSVAYIDPGNFQADIQAGATSRYSLLFVLWWTGMLSIYVQVLCVRLAFHSKLTLAEAMARVYPTRRKRYINWMIAEFSTMITDLPTVVGFAIAIQYFIGLPYYAGVLLSLVTTMVFLASMSYGMRILEVVVCIFVAIMSIALWIEMAYVGPNSAELFKGWAIGVVDVTGDDLFSIAGILGAVVMPHNLYLHSAAVQDRTKEIKQDAETRQTAIKFCSFEPIPPIILTFFVNMAVVSISAESVYGTEAAGSVGLTDFCSYFKSLPAGCTLWAIALLSAGQSSAITTTYTGQYVMNGYLQLQMPMWLRAVITRVVAILPGIVCAILFPSKLNQMINFVNALLGLLLPFAFTPLVKFNCSESIMGGNASRGVEKFLLYVFALAVWAVNALTLSLPGGGFFGDVVPNTQFERVALVIVQTGVQVLYALWNFSILSRPVSIDTSNVDQVGQPLPPMGYERQSLPNIT